MFSFRNEYIIFYCNIILYINAHIRVEILRKGHEVFPNMIQTFKMETAQ